MGCPAAGAALRLRLLRRRHARRHCSASGARTCPCPCPGRCTCPCSCTPSVSGRRRSAHQRQLRDGAEEGEQDPHRGPPLAAGVDARRPRRVRLRRPAAGRHVLRGAARRARAPPRQPRVGVPERLRAPGLALRAHLRRHPHLRAGRGPAHRRVPVAVCPRRRRRPHPLQRGHGRHMGMGLPRLLCRLADHLQQPRHPGGRRVRPAHRRRRHQGAPHPLPLQRQPDQERRVRDRAAGVQELHRGRAAASEAEGHHLAAPRVDHRVPQGRAVHRRRALLGARGAVRGGAGGGAGERHRAGDPHRAQPRLQPVLRGRRRQERLPWLHAGGGLRRERDAEGAVRVHWQGRVQADEPEVRRRRHPDQGHLLQLLLPHQDHRRRLPLRPRAGPGQDRAAEALEKYRGLVSRSESQINGVVLICYRFCSGNFGSLKSAVLIV